MALAGGVGAARLLSGVVRHIPREDLVIIGNTGDDAQFYGLHVSPDLDTVMYTLAGIVDEDKGWGVSGDTFHCLQMLDKLGFETWFQLGDRDLAVHIIRTKMLKEGMTLCQATAQLCRMLGVKAQLIPMTNDPVRTKIISGQSTLEFQEYFVKRGTQDKVTDVVFEGAEKAKPAPGILQAIEEAEQVIICPSNPILSIAPILSIPLINDQLKNTKACIVGVTPIVGGKAIKGPTARIMASMGLEVSAHGVVKYYEPLLDHMIIDHTDKHQKKPIQEEGVKVTVTDTIMKSLQDRIRLAKAVTDTEK